MKYAIIVPLLFYVNLAFSQSHYEIGYTNGEGSSLLRLVVGDDEFRLESMVGSMLKAKGESNTYIFHINSKGEYNATKANVTALDDALFMKINRGGEFFKIDTIYSKTDTLISSIPCKKVKVNYISAYKNEQGKVLPFDTIKYTYYVATKIKTITPMSIDLKKTKGLIIKLVKERMQYSVANGFVEKELVTNYVLSSIKRNAEVEDGYFKLPANCTFHQTIDDVWEQF